MIPISALDFHGARQLRRCRTMTSKVPHAPASWNLHCQFTKSAHCLLTVSTVSISRKWEVGYEQACWIHIGRAAGRDFDHRHSGGAVAACGADGAGGSPPFGVREQSQA